MQATEKRKGFLQNDRMLVCSMLVIYGVCLIGTITAIFWGLRSTSQVLSTYATATRAAFATQQANATATAIARGTELAQYELVDTFESNINHWLVGAENSKYWKGSMQIAAGFYIWDVREVKEGFVAWSDFSGHDFN